MKNLKLIITILAISFVAISCETTYDDFEEDRVSVIGFTTAIAGSNIVVPAGGSLEKSVNVFVSDVSNVDRTFTVVADTESTIVGESNYALGTLVVAANERNAVYTFTVTDVSLNTVAEPLTLIFDNSSATYVSGKSITFQVRKN